MKPPFFLIDGNDVSIFSSIRGIEGYVESPDIDVYEVYDSEGSRLNLHLLDEGTSGQSASGKVAFVTGVKVRPSDSPEMAADELASQLKSYLRAIGCHEGEGETELSHLVELTVRMSGFSD